MPKLPDATDLSGVSYGAPRSLVNMPVPDITGATGAIARGISDVGTGVAAFAVDRQEKFRKQERFDTKMNLLKAEEIFAEQTRDLDPLDPAYVEKKKAARREVFGPVLSGVKDPENRMFFDESTGVDYANISIKAADEHQAALGKKAELDIDVLTDEQRKRIRAGEDPQTVLADTFQTIDDNQFVDDLTKGAKKQQAKRLLTYDAVETKALGEYGKLSGGALVRAVIGAESSGNPNAVSPKGAAGLMQVMPATAAEIAAELGDDTFFQLSSAEQKKYLLNPNVSVRYGTHYLNKMLKRYDGDVEAALVAYNAGPGNADKWLKAGRDYAALPVPEETGPYVQKIFKTLGADPATVNVDPRFRATEQDVVSSLEQDPLFRDLPVDDADKLKASVLTTIKKSDEEKKVRDEALKATVKTAVASDIATIENGGAPSPDLTYETVAAALGVKEAEAWRANSADAAERANITSQFMSMSNAQIEALVTDYEAAVETRKGAPDYSRKLENLKKVQARQTAIVAERRDNPSQAALRFTPVQNAYQAYLDVRSTAVSNPHEDRNKTVTQAFGGYLQATTEAQIGFGIPRQGVSIVPDDVAESVSNLFLDLPADIAGRENNVTARDTLTRVYEQMKLSFGDYTDEVIAYSLAKTKPLSKETTETMVGLLSSLAKGKPIRRTAADTAQRLQDADQSDPGLMGFFDWFGEEQDAPADVPLGVTPDEPGMNEETVGAR
jgi:hypothetical protein